MLRKEEPEDEMLITNLLQTMHNTGADFTNTFRCLSQISCPAEEEAVEGGDVGRQATELLLQQCASLEELKSANKPSMDHRELSMLLSLAQSNAALFGMVSDRRMLAQQLEKLSRLKDLMESTETDLKTQQKEEWSCWINQYRQRLAREYEGDCDVKAEQEERVRVMNSTNPRVVLRNYIAQNAIEAAENGDFSEVQKVLKVLEKPFCLEEGMELPSHMVQRQNRNEEGEREAEEDVRGAENRAIVSYDSKPPAWAAEICVT